MTANHDLLVNYCLFPEPKPDALKDGRFVYTYGYGQMDKRSRGIKSNKGSQSFTARLAASKGKVVQIVRLVGKAWLTCWKRILIGMMSVCNFAYCRLLEFLYV